MADNAHSPLAGSGLPWSSDLGERRRFAVIMVVMLVYFTILLLTNQMNFVLMYQLFIQAMHQD